MFIHITVVKNCFHHSKWILKLPSCLFSCLRWDWWPGKTWPFLSESQLSDTPLEFRSNAGTSIGCHGLWLFPVRASVSLPAARFDVILFTHRCGHLPFFVVNKYMPNSNCNKTALKWFTKAMGQNRLTSKMRLTFLYSSLNKALNKSGLVYITLTTPRGERVLWFDNWC